MGRRSISSGTGRYQTKCGMGFCAISGEGGCSKLEGQVFTLLDYVLGPGKQGERIHASGGPAKVDMLFPQCGASAVIVEYDGAYFHRDAEERDRRKSSRIMQGGEYHPVVVVRLREAPLRPATELDVVVPARADAATCARLATLHLVHILDAGFRWDYLKPDVEPRMRDFIRAGGDLPAEVVSCAQCRSVLDEVDADKRWWRT